MSRSPQGRKTGATRPGRSRAEGGCGGTPPPAKLGAAISRLIAMRGLAGGRANKQLETVWREVAGSRIVEWTAVIGLNRGVLEVAVASSAMLGELASFHKGRLLAELRQREPDWKLRDIKFRLRGDLAR